MNYFHLRPKNPIRFLFLCLVVVQISFVYKEADSSEKYRVRSISEILFENAGSIDWSASHGFIAYDTKTSGKADIRVMKSDGSENQCLTCGLFPGRNVGNPAWSPDGKYLLFTAEKEDHGFLKEYLIDPVCDPGWGIDHALWVMEVDINATKPVIGMWSLIEVDVGRGVIHPHFSKDGEKVLWSEIMTFNDNAPFTWKSAKAQYLKTGKMAKLTRKWAFQDWRLRVAHFDISDNQPKLTDIQTLPRLPDVKILHEAHGFSPDGTKILFTSNNRRDLLGWFGFDIYTYDLTNGNLEQLTDTEQLWDEHAHYGPDGWIFWTTNQGFRTGSYLREYWIMDGNGQNVRQITHFNTPGYPEYVGKNRGAMVSDNSWNYEGTSVAAYVKEFDATTGSQIGKIFRIDLKDHDRYDRVEGDENEFEKDFLRGNSLIDSVKILKEDAIHGDFSPDGKQIVIDKKNGDEFYDIYIMQENGTMVTSLTENNSKINQRHNGWPVWHPTEKLIVFQSEEENHLFSSDPVKKYLGHPGLGFFSNLWAFSIDGSQVWQLTDIEIKQMLGDGIPVKGVINPVFNKDGTKLMWTERYAGGGYHNWGMWQIKSADFVTEGGPHLENEQIVLRAKDVCEKCNYVHIMQFSPLDENKLLLTGNLDGQHVYGMDQYIYDTLTGELTNLLNSPEYWEEGACWSPDGEKIVYPPNSESPYSLNFNDPNWAAQPRTREYWVMNADGTNKRKLTNFNTPGSPEYLAIGKGRNVIVAECTFSPDGQKMLGAIGVDQGGGNRAKFRVNLGLFDFTGVNL